MGLKRRAAEVAAKSMAVGGTTYYVFCDHGDLDRTASTHAQARAIKRQHEHSHPGHQVDIQ